MMAALGAVSPTNLSFSSVSTLRMVQMLGHFFERLLKGSHISGHSGELSISLKTLDPVGSGQVVQHFVKFPGFEANSHRVLRIESVT